MIKNLLEKNNAVELYKISVNCSSWYLVTCKDKKYIRSSLVCARALFNDLVNKNRG